MPKLSCDAILAALAVVAIGASGCSKKEEPPKATAEAVPAAAQPPAASIAATPTAAPALVAATDAGLVTDGPRKAPAPPKPGTAASAGKGSASCGAGTCGSDMRK